MSDSNAFKSDAEGLYIEMIVGEKKRYSINWTEELDADDIGTAVWTMDADGNVVKLAQSESGKIAQVTLHAAGDPGVWPCFVTMTGNAGGVPVDIIKFRVVIT